MNSNPIAYILVRDHGTDGIEMIRAFTVEAEAQIALAIANESSYDTLVLREIPLGFPQPVDQDAADAAAEAAHLEYLRDRLTDPNAPRTEEN